MNNMATFTLGDQEFEFPGRGIRFTKTWKDAHIRPLIEMVYEMENLDLSTSAGESSFDMRDISGLLRDIRPLIDRLVDVDELIVNAVIEWLNPDAEEQLYLEEWVLPRYFMAPLGWILSEIYPLGELQRMLAGAQPAGTGKALSLPKQNGAGAKRKRPKKK